MKIYKVVGHVDDGYTTHNGTATHIIVAENEDDACKVFADHYYDGWGGYAYDIHAFEVDTSQKKILR